MKYTPNFHILFSKRVFTLNGSLMIIFLRLTIGYLLEFLLSPNSRQGLRMRQQMRMMPATWQQLGSGKNLLCPRLGKGCQSYNMNHNPLDFLRFIYKFLNFKILGVSNEDFKHSR